MRAAAPMLRRREPPPAPAIPSDTPRYPAIPRDTPRNSKAIPRSWTGGRGAEEERERDGWAARPRVDHQAHLGSNAEISSGAPGPSRGGLERREAHRRRAVAAAVDYK